MRRLLCSVCLLVLAADLRAADLPDGWTQDWDAAVSTASENEKPIFAVFSATWCGPCQSMVKNIYPQDQVREELQSWVPVYIDVDKNEEIAAKYRANQLPTLVYLNPDATEINRTVGAVTTVEQMIELLDMGANPADERLQSRVIRVVIELVEEYDRKLIRGLAGLVRLA